MDGRTNRAILQSHGKEGGKKYLMGSYRPVNNILPYVSKIFERRVYDVLNSYFKSFMPKFQFSIQKQFSMQHCLLIQKCLFKKYLKI